MTAGMTGGTPAGERLAQRLRQERRRAGLTGPQLAERLGPAWDAPRISRIEHGRQIPGEETVRRWAAGTGGDEAALLDLRQRARAESIIHRRLSGSPEPGSAAAGILERTVALEVGAARVVLYAPTVVPGPLQTAAYAWDLFHRPRTVTGPDRSDLSDREVGRLVAATLRRRALLYAADRQVTLVMGEAALHLRYGSPASHREQLLHLAEVAESASTTATIAVVPFRAEQVVVAVNGWTVRDDVATLELSGGDLHTAETEAVRTYVRWTTALLDHAVTGPGAAALARRIAADLSQ